MAAGPYRTAIGVIKDSKPHSGFDFGRVRCLFYKASRKRSRKTLGNVIITIFAIVYWLPLSLHEM